MTPDTPIAVATGKKDRRRVTLQRVFHASIEELWAALVEPEQIRAWFTPARVEPRVGGRIELRSHDGRGTMMEGMVRVFEPPRIFEYDWVSPNQTSVVRYELEPAGAGTRLTLSESVLTDANLRRRTAGWHQHVERLEAHLRGEPCPVSETRWRELVAVYERIV